MLGAALILAIAFSQTMAQNSMTCPNGYTPSTYCAAGYFCASGSQCYRFPYLAGFVYMCCGSAMQAAGSSAAAVQTVDGTAIVNNDIRQNAVMLYTEVDCVFSIQVKSMLTSYGIQYRARDLDVDPQGPPIRAAVRALTRKPTVPYVFVCGQFIGGASEVSNYLRSGYFNTLLSQCNRTG